MNCLLEVSNGFLVCRDRFIELWNGEREQFGAQEVTEKITSAYYSPEEEKILYGTLNGSVVAMFNYEKMMLLAKERDSAKEKADLVKKIAELRAIKVGLATKLGELSSSKNVCFKAGRVSHTVQLDYARLCYCIDIVSEHKINRINAKG